MAVTHKARTGRLPAETDEFVGRAAELGQIDGLLRTAQLVTLVGPGGVGKSRIALRAAAAAQSRYPDGGYLAELSSLRDPGLLPHTVSRTLGLSDQAAGSRQDALLAYLRGRRLLLILDTCEHLVDACADLAQAIITEAPLVTVLATSREPLDVAGETTFAVRPLPVPALPVTTLPHTAVPLTTPPVLTRPMTPSLVTAPPVTTLPASAPGGPGEEPPPFGITDLTDGAGPGGGAETAGGDAVELFARRAAAAIPGFAVTDANRAGVTRICRALDGIPLAIELAAGRLRDLTLAEISGRLDRRLSLLTGGRDGNGARHATARNVVAWSYDTCTATERALWARLSLFPGVFDVDAAAEVCTSSELDGAAIFETIIGLVNKSVLVRVDPMTEADGAPPAFRMLDTVREFGAERLTAAGDGPGIRARLLARYLAMARRADKLGFGDHQPELFAGLSREHVSIRAALDFALEATPGQPSRERDGAELATRLWTYWVSSGLMSEGLYWLGKALDRVTSPCPQRAWAHAARCGLAAVHGNMDQAVADGRAAVELAKTLKLPQVAGRANVGLCLAYLMAGDLQAAERSGKAAERQLTSAGDTDGLIVLDAHLAALFQASGQPERGISYYKRGIARFRDGSGERIYHGHLHLAGAFCYLKVPGQEQECARVLSLALLAKYSLHDITGTAYGLELFGWLACAAGRHERAAWLLGAADPLWTKLGARLSNAASWQQRHADTVASTRTAVGDDAWSGLFRAGSAHPLGQVVALAINNADTLSDPVQVDARPGAGALTDREREIAFLAAAGLSAAQVAAQLFLPPRAVEEHLASVFGKLGVTSAAQLGPWLGEPAPRLSGPR